MEQDNHDQAAKAVLSEGVQVEGATGDLGQQLQVSGNQKTGASSAKSEGDSTTATTTETTPKNQANTNSQATLDTTNTTQDAKTPESNTQESKAQESTTKDSGEQPKPQKSPLVMEVGLDPDKYPDFLDLDEVAFSHLPPEHRSGWDTCAPYIFLGNQDELEGDENFADYDEYLDIDDDDDDDPPYQGEYNHAYLAQYDRQQMVPWVYPGAKWSAGLEVKKHANIRASSFQGYTGSTHTLTKITTQLERYYSEIRTGGRLKVAEKRTMLALLQERNRVFMPSGTLASSSNLNIKKLSQAEQDALQIIKNRLKSLMYYAQERDLSYSTDVANQALLWFHLKDANMLNQLRSLNGTGLLFVQEDEHPFHNQKGYTWYVNVRPKSFVELMANLRKFIGLRASR